MALIQKFWQLIILNYLNCMFWNSDQILLEINTLYVVDHYLSCYGEQYLESYRKSKYVIWSACNVKTWNTAFMNYSPTDTYRENLKCY